MSNFEGGGIVEIVENRGGTPAVEPGGYIGGGTPVAGVLSDDFLLTIFDFIFTILGLWAR